MSKINDDESDMNLLSVFPFELTIYVDIQKQCN